MYERRLLRWPPLVDSSNEDFVEINSGLIAADFTDATIEDMSKIGQKVGQKCPDVLTGRRPVCVSTKTEFLAVPIEWACETSVRHADRLPPTGALASAHIKTRPTVFESIASSAIPPTTLILALAGRNINPGKEVRQLNGLLRGRGQGSGWPPQSYDHSDCQTVDEVLFWLRGCKRQVVHLAGHMGGAGLQIGDDLVDPIILAGVLQESDVRLVVLNGCEGGKSTSLVAVDCLTLADRLIRDAGVAEVVAHRGKIGETRCSSPLPRSSTRNFLTVTTGLSPLGLPLRPRSTGSQNLTLLARRDFATLEISRGR